MRKVEFLGKVVNYYGVRWIEGLIRIWNIGVKIRKVKNWLIY